MKSTPNYKPFAYHEYSKKSILQKMPVQYIGIAKQLSSIKKQRIMSQQIFDSYHHEYSSIEKINNNLAKSLNKRKKQLKYMQNVRDRYISQSLMKQKYEENKQIQLTRLKFKNNQQRERLEQKLSAVKERLMNRKRKQSSTIKNQLNHYKSQKYMEQSRIYQRNQSRVREIQDQKKRIREYYNRFYQNKNKKVMRNYKDCIEKETSQEQKYRTEMKNLQEKIIIMRKNTEKKQKMLADLNSSIDSLRQSRQSVRSKQISTRSMTPLEIISGTTNDNPEKTEKSVKQKRPKLKLLCNI